MKTFNTIFLISMLLMASFSFPSQGLILNGLSIGFLVVRGVLFCSLDGNLNGNSPPVSNATVQLTCRGSNTDLGQALTNPAGFFDITVRILDTSIFDRSECLVRVNLPVATCTAFPPDGALTASVSLVSVIQSGLFNIANFTTGTFYPSIFY